MIKVFQTTYDFEGFTEGGMKSGNLYYVIEDKSVHFTTNNIDGISRNYGIGVGDDIVPEGNIDLTVNGNNIDVSSYATASVNVPIPAGYIQPSGNYDITVNGNYDVSTYATANINVASGGDNADLIDLIEGDITTLNIPSVTTQIRNRAFYNCTSLTNVTIPSSVTSIGEFAFNGCKGLTNITIPDSVTTIGNSVFSGCTGLTSISIGSGVTSIGNGAFSGCTGLTSITIPDSVTSIDSMAFYGCSRLTSITIGNSVTSIGDNAFNGCSSLTSITIPNSVTSIGMTAFRNCSALASITVLATTPPTLGTSAFHSNASGRKIYVPAESVQAYKAANEWSNYASYIEAIPSN